MNSIFLNALQCCNDDRTPVWLMRQAGRYLPSYQALRSKYSLLEMFHHPDLIVETTLLPLRELKLDAAILFADLLSLLDCLSIRWDFEPNQGPLILDPFEKIERIPVEDVYAYLGKAIRTLKQELRLPLIGFAGAPFTVASYLIERKSSRDLHTTKQLMYSDPKRFHALLHTIANATVEYLNFQIDAGVDAIQLFDSWAYVLSLHDFKQVSLYYMNFILKRLKDPTVPVILFCKGSCFFAKELASLSPTAISLDWQGDVASVRKALPQPIALQGNLDPAVLLGSKSLIQEEVQRLLLSMKGDPGYIFNLGHGILPATPFENVQFLLECIHDQSRSFAQTP